MAEKLKFFGIVFGFCIVIFLFVFNVATVKSTYFSDTNPNYSGGGNFGGMDLEDAKAIAQFIWSDSERFQANNVYLTATQDKYVKTMKFFLNQKPNFFITDKPSSLPIGAILFSIFDTPNQYAPYDNPIYTPLDAVHIDTYDVLMRRKNQLSEP